MADAYTNTDRLQGAVALLFLCLYYANFYRQINWETTGVMPSVASTCVLNHTDSEWLLYANSIYALLDYDAPYRLGREAFKERGAFPISFSHRADEWVDRICPDPHKTLEWSPMIPGDKSTYIYHTKAALKGAYLPAWKAHTWKKAGWDCNRHIEIMESGAIPVFRDAKLIPKYTMTLYPKRLLEHIEENVLETDIRKLALWRALLIDWGRRFLTTSAAMRYMLQMTEVSIDSVKSAAFIDSSLRDEGDYLSAFLLQGMIDVFGQERVDLFFPVSYLFEGGWNTTESDDDWHRESVRIGWYTTHFLKPNPMAPSLEWMEQKLRNSKYDLIVWGCQERQHRSVAGRTGVYYIHEANGKYRKNRLWLSSCDDTPRRAQFDEFDWATSFLREMQ